MNSWYHICSLVFIIIYLFVGIFYIDNLSKGDDISLFVLTSFTIILDMVFIFTGEDVILEKVLFTVAIFLCIFSIESLLFFPQYFVLEITSTLYGGYLSFKMIRAMIHRHNQVDVSMQSLA